MQRYEKYKDSGIDWLGEIPEHWEVKKITHLFKQIGSGTTPTAGSVLYYENGIINFLQTGDLNDSYIFSTSKKITEKALLEYSSLKIFPVGSLVIAMYGATIGKLGILKIEAATNQACCVLSKCQIDLELKYIFYWFMFAKNQILSMSYGGGQPNISQDLIKSLRVHSPSVGEQIAIVTFLEEKCKKIDAAINLKEQQIEKLKELRQITIHNAVTKGISPSVGETIQMKNSGIDWIGEIPEDWEVKRLKYTCLINQKSLSETTDKNQELDYVDIGSVSLTHGIEKTESYLFGNSPSRARRIASVNDTIISTVRTYLKAIDFIDESKSKFIFSTGFAILTPNGVSPKYLANVVRSNVFTDQVSFASKGMSYPAINSTDLGCLWIPIPPVSEQKAIITHLQEQTSKIDKAIVQRQEQIVKLKEYKQSLINEAVTGKIKIIA